MADLISRQAAIDEVLAWLKDLMTDGKNKKPLTERLKDLPSAQPEQKTGKWVDAINEDMNPFFRRGWKCTACGMRQTYGQSKYCPNCGCKMEGKHESDSD